MTDAALFSTFAKFNNYNEALNLGNTLDKNGIKYVIEDHSIVFDTVFNNNSLDKDFRLKIHNSDFEKAETIIVQPNASDSTANETEHYLYAFSDNELMEVVSNHDEWSKLDFQLAQTILKERGRELNADDLSLLKDKRIEELSKPEEVGKTWIYLGYISAILGGFAGIMIGKHVMNHQKLLPNKEYVYFYSASDRQHGKSIFIIGTVVLTLIVIYTISNYL